MNDKTSTKDKDEIFKLNQTYEIIPAANGYLLMPIAQSPGFQFSPNKFYVFSNKTIWRSF